MIWMWSGSGPHLVARFKYGHRGIRREQIDQHARVDWIEMLNQDEGHTASRRKRREESTKSLEAAGGSADRDDREGFAFRDRVVLGGERAGAPCAVVRGPERREIANPPLLIELIKPSRQRVEMPSRRGR
jgi:hypothetical protein